MLLKVCNSKLFVGCRVAVFTAMDAGVVLTYILALDATAELALSFVAVVAMG